MKIINKIKGPCIHGELCRAYMNKYGFIHRSIFDGGGYAMVIYSEDCPDCPFYYPKNKVHFEKGDLNGR